MSVDHGRDAFQQQAADSVTDPPSKGSHKSFRRKYRKIMVKFEEKMKESNTLFREEQRILDISRRLSEQNDQILELLYDLNRCPKIPPQLRYDLQVPGSATPKHKSSSAPEDDAPLYDVSSAQDALRKARDALRAGEMSLHDYQNLEELILGSPDFEPAKSYTSLLREVPHTMITSAEEKPLDPADRLATGGFPSSQQEEQYLQGLDAYLAGSSTTPRPFASTSTASAAAGGGGAASAAATRAVADRGGGATEKDRDMALRNPVSVYNWLRKHQPQVFLQDNEANSDKPPRASTSRISKRAVGGGGGGAASATIKQEQDLYDDDGFAVEHTVGSSATKGGKRKRDDDTGYRPKGGNSRPVKRKKDEGGTPVAGSGRRGKKLSSAGLAP